MGRVGKSGEEGIARTGTAGAQREVGERPEPAGNR